MLTIYTISHAEVKCYEQFRLSIDVSNRNVCELCEHLRRVIHVSCVL